MAQAIFSLIPLLIIIIIVVVTTTTTMIIKGKVGKGRQRRIIHIVL